MSKLSSKIFKLTQEDINSCNSISSVANKLGFSPNGRSWQRLKQGLLLTGLDLSPLSSYRQVRKYELVQKVCPVCNSPFETNTHPKKGKSTCSRACANTFFRSGKNHANYTVGKDAEKILYRRICFSSHNKECIICGENVIVEVHHFDGDHHNNSIENLIPVCPTHHKYMHSRHKVLILEQIKEYIRSRKEIV